MADALKEAGSTYLSHVTIANITEPLKHIFQQLTPEDETFLTEHATATLSQFEKVTANLGEHKGLNLNLHKKNKNCYTGILIEVLFSSSFRV